MPLAFAVRQNLAVGPSEAAVRKFSRGDAVIRTSLATALNDGLRFDEIQVGEFLCAERVVSLRVSFGVHCMLLKAAKSITRNSVELMFATEHN